MKLAFNLNHPSLQIPFHFTINFPLKTLVDVEELNLWFIFSPAFLFITTIYPPTINQSHVQFFFFFKLFLSTV
jgi:hypothetical protein